MKSFESRLKKAEEELIPDELFVVIHARHNHKEEDTKRQQEEYYSIHGRTNKNIKFLILNDYFDDGNYEEFINRMRSVPCHDNIPNFSYSWWKRRQD